MAIVESTSPSPSGGGFERLLRRLRPGAARVLRRYQIPEADAEDILQEAFLVFFLKQPEVEQPERWLLGTLRNRCRMYWRERRKHNLLTVSSDLVETRPDVRLSEHARRTLLRDLERLIGRLPHSHRQILQMCLLQGLSASETASRLGYRRSGIYKLIQRSKEALIAEMAGESLAEENPWLGS